MKYLLLLFVALTVITCSTKSTSVTPVVDCNPNTEHADSVAQASALLVGTWKLIAVQTDIDSLHRPPVPNQVITFKSDHTCIVTKDGQASDPVLYTVTMGVQVGTANPGGFNIVLRPQLTVQAAQTATLFSPPFGTSTLFICPQKLILDYGTPIDAPAYTYQRQAQ